MFQIQVCYNRYILNQKQLMLARHILWLLKSPCNITKIVNHTMPIMNFSTLFQKVRNAHYYDHVYKSANLKFQNRGLKMLAYQFNPQVNQPPMLSNTKHRQIICGKVVVLTFLAETSEEMKDEIWKNRKTISFSLRQCMQLFKLSTEVNKVIINQKVEGDENQIYNFDLQISYNKTNDQVTLQIFHSKTKQSMNSSLWDLKFLLKYNEYISLCSWIKNGLYYTSGAALMIQYSKQYQLLLASTENNTNWNQKVGTQKSIGKKK